jgi:hypothetical protein
MQTYNQIIKLNREFADAHYQIKTFGNGEAYNIVLHDKEAWFEYPLMWVEDQTLNINNNEFTFNFRVYFIAQVAQVTDQATDLDSTNENEVKSDMVQCAQDLLSYWAQDVSYLDLDLIKTGNSITTITDKFSDRVTGCYVDLRLKQGFTYNKCAIPMSDVPVSPAVCLPATYTNSDGSFTQEIASGGSYTAPDIVNSVNGVAQTAIPANTSTDYIIDVPVLLNTSTISKTGDSASVNSYDDGFLLRGRGVDFFTLSFNNPFGNNQAYTGLTGGYYDQLTSQYKDVNGTLTTEVLAFPDALIISWKSYDTISGDFFTMSYNELQTGTTVSMITGAGASGYTRGSFNGFYVCNINEMLLYFKWGGVGLQWSPVTFDIGAGGVIGRVATSTGFGTNYEAFVTEAAINYISATGLNTVFIGRYLNLTDIGL